MGAPVCASYSWLVLPPADGMHGYVDAAKCFKSTAAGFHCSTSTLMCTARRCSAVFTGDAVLCATRDAQCCKSRATHSAMCRVQHAVLCPLLTGLESQHDQLLYATLIGFQRAFGSRRQAHALDCHP
eukprot:365800-Chlamydomonas_euryale.AAC.33